MIENWIKNNVENKKKAELKDGEQCWVYWEDGGVSIGVYCNYKVLGTSCRPDGQGIFQNHHGTDEGSMCWNGQVVKAVSFIKIEKPEPPKEA